jgi:hypothetical protein
MLGSLIGSQAFPALSSHVSWWTCPVATENGRSAGASSQWPSRRLSLASSCQFPVTSVPGDQLTAIWRRFVFTTATTSQQVLGFNCAAALTQNAMYGVLYAYTPEAFPAPHRGTADAVCSAFNRITGAIAPLIAIFGNLETNAPLYVSAVRCQVHTSCRWKANSSFGTDTFPGGSRIRDGLADRDGRSRSYLINGVNRAKPRINRLTFYNWWTVSCASVVTWCWGPF